MTSGAGVVARFLQIQFYDPLQVSEWITWSLFFLSIRENILHPITKI